MTHSNDETSQDEKREALAHFLKDAISDTNEEAHPSSTLEQTTKGISNDSILPLSDDVSDKGQSKKKSEKKPTPTIEDKPKKRNKKKEATKPKQKKNQGWFGRITDITSSAFHIARKTTDTSFKVGKVLMDSQDQLKLMLAAGQTLKDLREVAGLTVSELSEAINVGDKTLLSAVEDGTSALSFELILRLASLLARNDPIPFIIKLTRAYSPETWRVLTDWGLGRIPLQYEREREFINIYRSRDEARKLSDKGFEKVLDFTRTAFEMSLHFITEQENILADQASNNMKKSSSSSKNETKDKKSTETKNKKAD